MKIRDIRGTIPCSFCRRQSGRLPLLTLTTKIRDIPSHPWHSVWNPWNPWNYPSAV